MDYQVQYGEPAERAKEQRRQDPAEGRQSFKTAVPRNVQRGHLDLQQTAAGLQPPHHPEVKCHVFIIFRST